MKKKILFLALLLVLNGLMLGIINAKQEVKVCQGYSKGMVLYLGSISTGIKIGDETSADFSLGWNVIRCCKTSNTQQNWCDFLMDDPLCKSAYNPGALGNCLTGTLED
jgi:hypothetical protein